MDQKGKREIRVIRENKVLRAIPAHKAQWDHKVLRVIEVKPAPRAKTEI